MLLEFINNDSGGSDLLIGCKEQLSVILVASFGHYCIVSGDMIC